MIKIFKKWYNNRSATEKGAIISGLFLIAITILTIAHQRSTLKQENKHLNNDVTAQQEEIKDLKSERNKLETQLAPFLAVANRNFADEPPDKRLPLLTEKIDQIVGSVQDSKQEILVKLTEIQADINKPPIPSSRSITPEATLSLIENLKYTQKLNVEIVSQMGNTEAVGLATEIKNIFEKAGWTVEGVKHVLFPKPIKNLIIQFSETPSKEIQKALLPLFDDLGYSREAAINKKLENNKLKIIVGEK